MLEMRLDVYIHLDTAIEAVKKLSGAFPQPAVDSDTATLKTHEKPSEAVTKVQVPEAYEPAEKENQRPIITVEHVMRAAAEIRDAGHVDVVLQIMRELGVQRLSELNGDKLETMAARLRDLGAHI